MLALVRAALALGAVVPAAAVGAASVGADERVRAVEVQADGAARLRSYVELQPGQPLDREAVRRAVELMFATGRFEDIPVEIVRDGEGGLRVVFRPIPAPVLTEIKVEGDRVLSSRAVAKLARLRRGEPLWPARLERAARDIALALERRGRPEALVEPDSRRVARGAEAVFRIHAGPSVRVGRLSVEGAPPALAADLRSLARPQRGAVYRRDEAAAARDAMQRRLIRSGHWRARVELRPTYDPARATMDLAFDVQPGPRTTLEIRGASLPRGLAAGIRETLNDGGATADTLEAGVERIEPKLRQQGHRDVAVSVKSEPREGGETVLYEIRPGARATVATLELRGADAALLDGLMTRPGRPLLDASLGADERTLVARLETLGHYEARVETDVPDGGGALAVVFIARPGPRALVGAVEIESPRLPTSSDDRGPEELAVHEGQPYRLAEVARSRDTLVSAWRRAGYLDVRVRPEVVPLQPPAAGGVLMKVRFVVEPGSRSIVDHLVLAGLGRTQPAAVEREMVLRRGEPFSFERVLESQRRLSSLGIFERVSISELTPSREQRDVVVTVQEAPRTTVSYGLGYSEQDRVRGSVELTRRNLGGLGRTASLFARASFRGSRVLANLREPWLFGSRLDSFATVFWEEEDRSSFDFTRRGAILQVSRALDPRTSLIARYSYQDTAVYALKVPLDEIDRQYRTYAVSGPLASLVFDTRDDPLEPKRGLFLSADLQLSLQALGGESFARGYFQATNVRRLRADLVLVVSGRLGLAGSLQGDTTNLPLPERFFAGGDFGPRGFAVDAVGPSLPGSSGGNYPVGGNALLIGGTELRYNVTRAIQLASFLDLGNVYDQVNDIDLAGLRRSVGLGVRYRTPIGPIRLDWGYVLDHKPSESRSHFHLTIGHAF